MSRIDEIFARLRAEGAKALMPFLCGGHPGPGSLEALIPAVAAAGASVVEVGLPFSDPIADGPVIAAAMHDALERGATPQTVLEEVWRVRDRVSIGLVAMVSVSLMDRKDRKEGRGAFTRAAAAAGFDGLIVPDVPLEESRVLVEDVKEAGLTLSLLISPSTPAPRAEQIVGACTGFVYLLARAGITGEREGVPDIADRVAMLRRMTDLPIAVGFGVSRVEHVREVVAHADAAIVGSALIRRISGSGGGPADQAQEAGRFVSELMAGLARPSQQQQQW